MKLNIKTLFVIGAVLAVAGTVIGARQLAVSQSKAEPVFAEKPTPDTVKFAGYSPELSSFTVAPMGEAAMPVVERVNVRIACEENVTARVILPAVGSVLSSHAEVEDRLVRNAMLFYINSPDMAAAEAGWRESQVEQLRKLLADRRVNSGLEVRANRTVASFVATDINGLYDYLLVERRTGVLVKRRVSVVLSDNGGSYIDRRIRAVPPAGYLRAPGGTPLGDALATRMQGLLP